MPSIFGLHMFIVKDGDACCLEDVRDMLYIQEMPLDVKKSLWTCHFMVINVDPLSFRGSGIKLDVCFPFGALHGE